MPNPTISRVRQYPYPSTVEVYFTHSMEDNAAFRSTSSYLFNRGAYTTGVEVLDAESVRLTVENLFGFQEFFLTIGEGLVSIDGYALDTGISVVVRVDMEENSALALSAGNGTLKSGRQAIRVETDSEYFYILTESGLDVVDKDSLYNVGFVLQIDGFNGLFIAGD